MSLRTENQAEYQRRFRFAQKVRDTIENVLAMDEHECGARFPRFTYTPMHLCGPGKGSSVLYVRHRAKCPHCK
jgi:hypothetical protein